MVTVWYIHGANSTPKSFNYLRANLPEHDARVIAYDHTRPVTGVVDALVRDLDASPVPVALVGHSLGGVIALAAAQRSHTVARIATLAAPFGGSSIATLMRWVAPAQVFDDIHPHSTLMAAVRRAPRVGVPTLALVTTAGGSGLLAGENDGVVTVESQTAIPGLRYHRVDANHFEVLLCPTVAGTLTTFLA